VDLREGLFTRKETELATRKCEIHMPIGKSDFAWVHRERRSVEISVAAVYDRRTDQPSGSESLQVGERVVFCTISRLEACAAHRRSVFRQLGQCPILARLSGPPYRWCRMGQQLRRRAKRKRHKAYLERKEAKQKSMRREPTRAKPKKSASPPPPAG